MTDEPLKLAELTEDMAEQLMDFLDDFAAAGEPYRGDYWQQAHDDFPAFVRKIRNNSEGKDLVPGHVPETMYVLVRGQTILGGIHLRHRLTRSLRDLGGHIGYAVRPSHRRKGYGTEMLRLVLAEARGRGLRRVMVTCDADNVASARVIENNGGRLDSEGLSKRSGKVTRRYWIDLDRAGGPGESS